MSSIPDPTDLTNPDVVRLREDWTRALALRSGEQLRESIGNWVPSDDWELEDYVALQVALELLAAHDEKDRWWT